MEITAMKRIITENGKSFYHIVTSRTAEAAEQYAASVLYQYLFRATGALVPPFSDNERCPRRSPEIQVGRQARGIETDVSGIASSDGFLIQTRGEDIVIAGKTPRGTVYGVYYFLKKFTH